MTTDSVQRFDRVAILLHWLMALAIIGLWVVGHLIDVVPKGPSRSDVIFMHKSVGVIILVLAVARLAWRLTRQHPALPAAMPAWEQLLARLGHWALYGLMLAMPADGILMSQSGGREVSVFGLVLPNLLGKDEGLNHLFKEGHELLGWVLAVVVIGHAAAALRHHFILKDNVLTRMLPSRG